MIDWTPDSNLHRVARFAAELADRIREEDPRELYEELTSLCHRHPAKATQMLMALAAWFDPDQTTAQLVARAESISEARLAAQLGRTA